MTHENEEFRTLLLKYREQRKMSQDDLAYAARELAPKMTGGYIGHLERGEKRPSADTIAALARGLDLPAETFTEYRLALIRRLFDEREIGLDQAEANLRAVGDGVQAVLEEMLLELEGRIEQLSKAKSRSEQSAPGRKGRRSGPRKSA